MLVLDHIAVVAMSLEEGAAHAERLLGQPLSDIGRHARMGTHNRLLSLGPGTYLEVIAVDPEAPPPAEARWFDLDHFTGPPRLSNWIARTDDLSRALAEAPDGVGVPLAFERGPYLWQMAVPPDGKLPYAGAAPALIEWESAVHPADRLPDRGCRLVELVVEHPEAGALSAAWPALGRIAGVSLRDGPALRLAAVIETPGGVVTLT